MKIELKILNKEFYSSDSLPKYATRGSAAVDLVSIEDIIIHPGETKAIFTGLAVWIASSKEAYPGWQYDMGVAGLIIPRSGLGTKGLVLANTIGVIDEDYQGEIIAQAWNRDRNNLIELRAGERIAQLMFVPVGKAEWVVVDEFSEPTERGEGGFGSTGR